MATLTSVSDHVLDFSPLEGTGFLHGSLTHQRPHHTFSGHFRCATSLRGSYRRTGASKSPSMGFVVRKSQALASSDDRDGRSADCSLPDLEYCGRPQVKGDVVDCRESRRVYPARRDCFIFGCAASAILSKMFIVLCTQLTSCSAGQERSRDRPPEAKCAVANGDFRTDAQPAIFTSTSGARALGAFLDTNLEAEELLLPFSRRRFRHPITRARTWNRVDARV